MKLIISPVEYAKITIDNKETRQIWKGLLVYVGISKQDCELLSHSELVSESNLPKDTEINSSCQQNPANPEKILLILSKISNKLQNLQLFHKDWKISASLKDIDWEILLVSNFTLYGKNKKWNKIDFLDSWNFANSKKIYDMLVDKLRQDGVQLQTWEFGAYMEIESKNNWPLNYVLEF